MHAAVCPALEASSIRGIPEWGSKDFLSPGSSNAAMAGTGEGSDKLQTAAFFLWSRMGDGGGRCQQTPRSRLIEWSVPSNVASGSMC